MNFDEFPSQGHVFIDWMADYLENIENYPVRARVRPGEIAARLTDEPPAAGESMTAIFEDFRRNVLPGVTHWQHPGFFAYFTANASPPSVLAEMLTATLSAQCMLWHTSPAATEMETKVLDWVRQMIGLPGGFHGVIKDSASGAILCAILTAREKATGWAANAKGLKETAPLAVYTSGETHSATEKGVRIAGLGAENPRKIAVRDDFHSIRPHSRPAIEADIATGVGAVDPPPEIGGICRAHDIFPHVDAAWAGSALILPEERWMIEGIEHVDSFVFNPHEWLFTNFDCAAHFVRDPGALVRTLSILPEFLKSRETGQVIDYRDWSVPLGRRFRALKLWFVIRSYGVERLKEMVRAHIDWASELEGRVRDAPDFELTSPRRLALLSFRQRPEGIGDEGTLDALNERLLHALNDGGRVYLTQTRVNGHYVIRFNIGQTYTTRDHIGKAWAHITETARALGTKDTAADA